MATPKAIKRNTKIRRRKYSINRLTTNSGTLLKNDIPYVVYQYNQTLYFTTYSPIQGQWTGGVIDLAYPGFSNFTVASDLKGGVGVAYLTQNPGQTTLGYAYTDGSGFWQTERLNLSQNIGAIRPDRGIGLTFDADNNPVISFTSASGVWIAYDSLVVPEPASLIILGFGSLGLVCRRREIPAA